MEVADIVVKLRGDASGLTHAISQAQREVGGFGASMSSIGQKLTLGLTVPLVALGAAILKIGEQFDSAFDTIRIKTGQTGQSLAGLEQSFRTVVANVPASFQAAADAIGLLHARTNLVGPALEQLAEAELELARITGGDLATQINTTTRLFGDWGVATDQQVGTLDKLFRATQAGGGSIDQLSARLVQFGAPLRQMGFGLEQSIALLAKFEKEGVNVELVLGSMRIALTRMANEGIKDPAQALQILIERIQKAGDAGKANALAMQVFGARAGPDMAAAIREGRFAIDQMLNTISSGPDTIKKAAAETKDFGERFIELRNKIMLALEPMAGQFFDSLNNLIPAIENIAGVIVKLVDIFTKLPEPVRTGIIALAGIAALSKPIVVGADLIIGAIRGIRTALIAMQEAAVASRLPLLRTLGAGAGLGGLVGAGIGGMFIAGQLESDKQMAAIQDRMRRSQERFAMSVGGAPQAPELLKKQLEKITFPTFAAIEKQAGEAGKKTGKAYNAELEKMLSGGGGGGKSTKNVLQEIVNHINSMVPAFQEAGLSLSEAVFKGLGKPDQSKLQAISKGAQAVQDSLTAIIAKGAAERGRIFEFDADAMVRVIEELARRMKIPADRVVATLAAMGVELRTRVFPEIDKSLLHTGKVFQDMAAISSQSVGGELAEAMRNFSNRTVRALKEVEEEAPKPAAAIEIMAAEIERAITSSATVVEAQAEERIRSSIEGLIETFARMGERAGKSGTELVKHVSDMVAKSGIQFEKFGAEADKIAKKVWIDFQKSVVRLPGVWDGVMNELLEGLGKFHSDAGVRIKGFFDDLFGIINTMPGKWGDALRKVQNEIEKWMSFLDRVIRLVERLFGESDTEGLGGLLAGLSKIFKQTSETASSSVESMAASVGSASSKAADSMRQVGEAAQSTSQAAGRAWDEMGASAEAGATKILGSLSSIMAGVAGIAYAITGKGGPIGGAISGALGGLAIGGGLKLLIGGLFGSILPGLGAAIGGIVGLISGFFGGKSKTEKELGRQQLEKGRLEIQRMMEDVKKAMLETVQGALQAMRDALALFEEVPAFARIPKAHIQAFMKNLEQLLNQFVELAGKWSKDMLDKAKAFAESVGPVVEMIGRGVASFDALSGFIGVSNLSVASFGAAMEKVIVVLGEILDNIEKRSLKLARRLAEKMSEIVGLVGSGVQAFAGLFEFQPITEASIQAFADAIKTAITKFMEVNQDIDQFLLKQASKAAERMAAIVDIIGSGVEALKGLAEFQAVPAEIFDAFYASIKDAANRFIETANLIDAELLARAQTVAGHLGVIVDAIKQLPEAFNAIREYRSIPSQVFSAIMYDFEQFAAMIDYLLDRAMRLRNNVEAFAEAVLAIRERLAEALNIQIGGDGGGGSSSFRINPLTHGDSGQPWMGAPTEDPGTRALRDRSGLTADAMMSGGESVSTQSTVIDKSIHIGGIELQGGAPESEALRRILERLVQHGQRLALSR